MESVSTPLCPAGHLPHKGGEGQAVLASPPVQLCALSTRRLFEATRALHPLSPLVGEMSGRTEGGMQRIPQAFHQS